MKRKIYIIDYCLHGEPKNFVIQLDDMSNAIAWNWASCDAGVGTIPKPTHPEIRHTSKPIAERYGVTDVRWRVAGEPTMDEPGVAHR